MSSQKRVKECAQEEKKKKKCMLTCKREICQRRRTASILKTQKTHLQPASDSLSAYILPMSPMPINPTVKFSIPAGTLDGAEAIAALLLDGDS